MVSQLTKLRCCLTSDLFCSQKLSCKLFPLTLHSTSWYWCDRCIGPVFHPGQSPTLQNSRVRRCKILKYRKSGLSCLFAYQFRQSIVWTMELVINAIWAGENIRWCIARPSGSLLVGSGPVRRPQGFPSDY